MSERCAPPIRTSTSKACRVRDLAPMIQGGFPFDAARSSRPSATTARRCGWQVDTVILGCTHYPLVAPMLQRTLGRGVTLSPRVPASRAASSARCASRRLLNPSSERGQLPVPVHGDVESFRALGTRFLQMPSEEVVHVELEATVPA